ncbi:MAG: NfeD family protein [Nitriliruptoraceae bacterium]
MGLAVLLFGAARADVDGPVHVLEVTGVIDLGLAPFLDRALDEADEAGASAVVVRIDTPGGRLDAVLEMRDALLRSSVRTLAFIDQTAFSAGSLVALASEEIYMTPAAVMGAATPVTGEGMTADPKVVSAVRSTFRSTAEQRGRDPRVAEAMVDAAVDVEGLVGRGELLTLTTSEAREWGYAEGVTADLDAVFEAAGLVGRPVVYASPSLAERLVRFVTNPVLASLLLMIGVWLIVGDLLSGGVGIGIGVGAGLLAVFFWGHLLAGLAGWEDVALVALGVVLILVEVVVIPGFGVAGVLGLAAVGSGTLLAMLNRNLDFVAGDQMLRTATIVAASLLGLVAATIGLLTHLSRRRGPEGVVLRARVGSGTAVTPRSSVGWLRWFGSGGGVLASQRATDDPSAGAASDVPGQPPTSRTGGTLTGAVGVALSDLRPAGVAEIDGERVDVVTEGEYLEAGERVEVVRDEGYRRIVRRRPT